MIQIATESIISLSDAAKLFPRRRAGRKPHLSTLYRWSRTGYHGVRLEVVRVGRTLCTSQEAIQRFIDAMTAADPMCQPATAHDDQLADQSQVEHALDDLGV